ncbi:MAG: lipid-A-disaccharide synthase [Bacteroidales bacterium]
MKYYIIAGEASGDLHGSSLMKALQNADPSADFRFWGGDLMMAAGGTLVSHIKKSSFMGFWEVFLNIRSVLAAISLCKRDIIRYKPDALILVDYPGFNLRIAKFAGKLGTRVFYYISPKVWAWNQSRVKTIKKYVDHMLTIFPFETAFYEKFDYKVDYVGNPLIDAIENRPRKDEEFDQFAARNGLSGKPVIAILAGSRIHEIDNCLPVMLSVTQYYPEYQFVIAGAPAIDHGVYLKYTGNRFPVIFGETYSILSHASAAMVVSGTATLEAALLGVPIIVCYKGSFISYQIARRIINVEYISLVNLIMEREVVRELIQHEFNSSNLKYELDRLLFDKKYRDKMVHDIGKLRQIMGKGGASRRAAGLITGYLKKNNDR